MDRTKEYILCAAIKYMDMKDQYLFKDVKQLILLGHRHNNIIDQFHTLTGLKTIEFGNLAAGKHIQGFLTSKNRFVDRREALKLAYNCGQCKNLGNQVELHSEDIY